MSDLTEFLRSEADDEEKTHQVWAGPEGDHDPRGFVRQMRAAANLIEEMRAENERLREENERCKSIMSGAMAHFCGIPMSDTEGANDE